MSVLNQSGEEQVECPLCMEPLEVDDLNFFPCTCGYQICRFCWHRIRTDENGLCPACRKAYPENPADFKPLSQEEVSRLKQEKRHKDHQRKQKVTENRKHLANVRVVQRNLVFVVGLPMRLADPEVLKKHEYFGKFGKIHKVVINQSTTYAGSQGPSASAYVTYLKSDDALRAIQAVQNVPVDGRTIKTSLGTTKYCSHFMKNQPCPKPDCMYLHDHGDPEASFTKEEMQQGKHQEFEKKLHDQLLNAYNKDRKPTPSPPSAVGPGGQPSIQPSKEAWPSLQPGSNINSVGPSILSSASNSTNNSSSSLNSSSSSNSNGSNNNNKGEGSNQKKQASSKNKKKNNINSTLDDVKGKSKDKHNSTQNSEKEEGHRKTNSHQVQSGSSKQSRTSDRSSKIEKNRQADLVQDHRTERTDRSEKVDRIDKTDRTDLAERSDHRSDRTDRVDRLERIEKSDRLDRPDKTEKSDRVEKTERLDNCEWSERADRRFASENHIGEKSHIQQSDTVPSSLAPVLSIQEDPIPVSPTNLSTSRLPHRASSLLEPDNNSFFSAGFTKVNASSPSSGTSAEWPPNGLTLPHMPDVLPPVHSSEDWQAAFGFTPSNSITSAPVAPVAPAVPAASAASDTKQTSAAAMLAKYQAWLGLTGQQQKVENSGVNIVSHNSVGSAAPSTFSHQSNSFGPIRMPDASNVLMHSPFQQQQQQQQQQRSFLAQLQQQQQVLRLQHVGLTSAGPEVGFPVGDADRDNSSSTVKSTTNGPTDRPDTFLHFERNSTNSPKTSNAENYFKYETSANNSGNSERRQPDDDLGFDPFHETQKGLAEMIEKEQLMKQQLQSQLQLQHQQQQLLQQAQFATLNQHNYPQHSQVFGHRLTPQVSNCTKLLEGLSLGLNNSVPARSRPPPPGFAPAPNHMNAFGLGIPRTPSNNSNLGSKVLPFMGLSSAGSSGNNSSASSSSGSQNSQGPQPLSYMSNGSVLSQGMGKTTVDSMFASAKEWPENLRSLLPNLGNNMSSQPPSHSFAAQKSVSTSWNCPDWTVLDPAIVSSSRPHWPVNTPLNAPTPPPGFGFGQQIPHTLNTANMDNL